MICRGDDENEMPEVGVLDVRDAHYKMFIPVGFPFGDTKQWKIFVATNGVISLGKNLTASELASQHPSDFGYVIAPFWSDFKWEMNKTSVQFYDSSSSQPSEKWENVKQEIVKAVVHAHAAYPPLTVTGTKKLTKPQSFDPKTILVLNWNSLNLKPFETEDQVTMQAIIASDGTATIVMFNYDTGNFNINSWEDPAVESDPKVAYNHRGFVGFQMGERRFCLNKVSFGESTKDGDCRSFLPQQLVVDRGDKALPPGRHVFLVANNEDVSTMPDRQCMDAFAKYEGTETMEELVDLNDYLDDLHPDPCPWTETQVRLDRRFSRILGTQCYSKRFSTEVKYFTDPDNDDEGNYDVVQVRAQCCYRANALQIQESGESFIVVEDEELRQMQEEIQLSCCNPQSAHCILANYFVPAQYVGGYKHLHSAAVYGDPHLLTFDGVDVTFKAHDDFVLYQSENGSVHGRFDAVGDSGSGLTRVAWQFDSSKEFEVFINDADGTLKMMVDNQDVDLSQFKPNPIFDDWDTSLGGANIETYDFNHAGVIQNVVVTYENGLNIEAATYSTSENKYYLHFGLRMPAELVVDGEYGGLLAEGFVDPEGTRHPVKIYPTLGASDKEFFEFGKKWSVENSGADKLLDGDAPDNSHTPQFFDDQDVLFGDGDKPNWESCKENMACAYDLATTGDMQISNNTLSFATFVHRMWKEEREVPPKFVGDNAPIWLINVRASYVRYEPEIDDYTDVTFTVDTDFPKEYYKIGILLN